MFLVNGALYWSASDLASAALCEYASLRTLDYTLGRADRLEAPGDPFQEHIARLGARHEARALQRFQDETRVTMLPHVDRPYTPARLMRSAQVTEREFAGEADILYQPTFFDGEFFGYADFVQRTDEGWQVCDAKLARSAKPQALLQLGAYADQVQRLGLQLAPRVSLLLGSGQRAEFPNSEVLPVFMERRQRLRQLISTQRASDKPVEWGDDTVVACGQCTECEAAAHRTNGVILVAGLRMDQRRKLRLAGIASMNSLALATVRPQGMVQPTFDKLRAQASLQWKRIEAGGVGPIEYELTDTARKS